MKKVSVVLSILGMACLALPVSVLAQEEEAAPAVTEVWMIVPKAGMEGEFNAAAAEHMAFRIAAEDSRSWQAFNVEIGREFAPVQFRGCCFDWADQDAYDQEEEKKGFGENWNENVHQYVDHYHRYFETFDYENSHWPDGEGDGPFYGVTTWKLKESNAAASSAAVDKMSQLAIDEDWDGNWLWISRTGGSPVLMIVSSYASYADMAPPEQSFGAFAIEKLGEEAAGKMFADFSSGLAGSDYTVWRRNDALSMPQDDE